MGGSSNGTIFVPADLFTSDPSAGAVSLGFILTVSSWLLQVIANGAMTRAIADAYVGDAVAWRPYVSYAFKRGHSIVWVSVLAFLLGIGISVVPGAAVAWAAGDATDPVGLGVFIGVLVSPLALWLSVSWTAALPALVVDDVKGMAALTRSFRLIKGRWWPTATVLFLANLLAGFVLWVVVGLRPMILVGGLEASALASSLAGGILAGVAAALIGPLLASVAFVIYFDQRVRKEGLDLQLAVQQMPEPAEPPVTERPLPPPPPRVWEPTPSYPVAPPPPVPQEPPAGGRP